MTYCFTAIVQYAIYQSFGAMQLMSLTYDKHNPFTTTIKFPFLFPPRPLKFICIMKLDSQCDLIYFKVAVSVKLYLFVDKHGMLANSERTD